MPSQDTTMVSLQAFLERIIAEMDLRYEQRFKAQEAAAAMALTATKEALTIALSAAEKSHAATVEANKLLAAKAEEFADQKLQTHNAIKPWVQSLIDASNEKMTLLERRVSRFENREEGMGLSTKLIVGGISLIATLVSLYFAFN